MADTTDAKTSAAAPAAAPKPAPSAASEAKPAATAKPALAPVEKVAAPAPAPKVAEAKSEPAKPVSTPAPAAKPVEAKPTSPVAAKPAPVVAKPAPKPVAASKPAPAVAPKTKATPAAKAVTPKPVEVVAKKRGRPPKAISAPKPVAIVAQKAKPVAAAAKPEGNIMNDTVAKAQETAKKFTSEATARTQALFGEMTERAKTSYEKSVKLAEEMGEFSKGNMEAIVESSKVAAKGVETLTQDAADYARKSLENSTAAFKTFASAKSPTEFFKLQSDYAKSYFDTAVAESSKVTEAWLKLAGDVAQPLSNRYAVAVEKIKIATA